MKVAQINSVCGYGSTGRIMFDLDGSMQNHGINSIMFYGREKSNSKNAVKFADNFSVYSHVVATRLSDKHGFFSHRNTTHLIKELDLFNPDIIHLHNIHGYYVNIKLLFNYIKNSRASVVWTLHDCWAFTGHCAHFDYIGCEKWKSGCYSCPQTYMYPKSFKDNSKLNYTHKKDIFSGVNNLTITTPSYWLQNIVKQSFLNSYPVNTIYNGIDISVFKPSVSDFKIKYGIENRTIVLGVANFWDERKGFNDFIRLSKILSNKYQLVMVGLSARQLKGLPKNIIGIARTESVKELAEIYTAADIYFNASTEETMGLTTVEALACGTPAIVYNATALPELINDQCGIVVEKNNINLLVKTIYEFDKEKISSNACILRAEEFEKNKQYAKYIALYKNIIGG